MEAVMKNVFGFENFKSVHQQDAIAAILYGDPKNFIINMMTQGGKSLCYQLPGNHKNYCDIVRNES